MTTRAPRITFSRRAFLLIIGLIETSSLKDNTGPPANLFLQDTFLA